MITIKSFIESILRPVEYVGPLSIKLSFNPRFKVVDQNDEVILETWDEQWAKDCVEWYNSRVR